MPLPIAISVPHAGLTVPDWLAAKCQLTTAEIIQDGDEQAAEIYAIADEVAAFVTTEVARAVLDLNRAVDDRRKDGVVKTHTCYDIPVWSAPLTSEEEARLLDERYHPYHQRLSEFAQREDMVLAVDCHTMAAVGPPIAPDTGETRPWVCLGDVHGRTLPKGWMETLAECFHSEFGAENVAVNNPFAGGYITQTHGRAMPWLQLEISRAPFMSGDEKRSRTLKALTALVKELPPAQSR